MTSLQQSADDLCYTQQLQRQEHESYLAEEHTRLDQEGRDRQYAESLANEFKQVSVNDSYTHPSAPPVVQAAHQYNIPAYSTNAYPTMAPTQPSQYNATPATSAALYGTYVTGAPVQSPPLMQPPQGYVPNQQPGPSYGGQNPSSSSTSIGGGSGRSGGQQPVYHYNNDTPPSVASPTYTPSSNAPAYNAGSNAATVDPTLRAKVGQPLLTHFCLTYIVYNTPISTALMQALRLVDMGFPYDRAERALQHYRGDEHQALNSLLDPDSFTAAANSSYGSNNTSQPPQQQQQQKPSAGLFGSPWGRK